LSRNVGKKFPQLAAYNPEDSHLLAVLLDSAAIFKVPARCDDIEVQDERQCVFDLS
jgi:hypothetical protein